MAVNEIAYKKIKTEITEKRITLVAVSKTKPTEDINKLFLLGQRDFGENYVQELVDKHNNLSKEIKWHFIGHLQRNKVKYIAPFVYLIHGVDSFNLLEEINKQAAKNNRIINCLLQVHIAEEETKFGFNENELDQLISLFDDTSLKSVCIKGLMGMASFTNEQAQVRNEFKKLKLLFEKYKACKAENVEMEILSMGMSSDYKIAIEEGSTMVRIGSLLFGERDYNK